MRYLRAYLGMFIHPLRTLRSVESDPRSVRFAIFALVVHVLLAGSKQLFYHFTGVYPGTRPFLPYPVDRVWLYSFFALIPTVFCQGLLFALVATGIAKLFRGRGSVRTQFALYGLAFPPVVALLIVGTFILHQAGLGNQIIYPVYFGGLMIWEGCLITLSVIAGQKIGFLPALLCAAPASALAVFFTLIFLV